MIIKSFIALRLREPITTDALSDALAPFLPPTSLQVKSTGWVPPLDGDIPLTLTLTLNGRRDTIVIRQHTEEKVLPAASIRKLIKDEARKLDRKPTKADIAEIRDRVITGLLPNALIKESDVFGVIHNTHRLLLVGTSSETKAADFVHLLRNQLEGLQVHRLRTARHPGQEMARWCRTPMGRDTVTQFNIENKATLRTSGKTSGIVRLSNIDIRGDLAQDVFQDGGAEVKELELTVDDNLNFVLTEDLTLKSIKFLDVLQEQVSEHANVEDVPSAEAQLFIEAATYAPLVNRIVEWFGGEPENDNPEQDDDEI